jgi:hypothetical protein
MDKSTLGRDGVPYTALTNAVMDDERVTKLGLLVYMAICRFARYNTRVAWPGKDTLAVNARISKRSVFQGLKNLSETGWLKIVPIRTKKGRRNEYTLCDDARNPTAREVTSPLKSDSAKGGEANTALSSKGGEANVAAWVRQYLPKN